ncbi:acetolactate synthase large subunit [Rhodospirillaceae bacterium KN72]|uniref:Acetolactate synthase large subunit n=1 Tax=Pacificispira spongiicola TaxID=2729598 RepID=A0A7Y0DWJ6_9PROT|nr:acetolactate synthase large subunit [Pacificispira spongiicola]NMM42900.1 acetolactate synthase large subunit [Pacificispira spongiicola]
MKASDLFVKCLEEEGVERIFGVPGEENADLMISLMDSKIDFVLCRHEQAAAFAADAYGRLTGKAGVCLATLGPGATNLVTGLADANMDRAPLVAIIGQGSLKRLHKESHQNMDSVAMMRPISKWAQSIVSAGNITEVVRKAFKVAETEKPGVAVIELPEDVAKQDVDDKPMRAIKVRRPAADHKAIAEAARLIGTAKKPIILAGNGAIRKRAAKQLQRLAQKTGIGVVNTFMGKGAVPMDDPHCLFTMGLGSGDYNNLAFDDADLVISCGYDLVEYAPAAWNRHNKDSKTIIHLDFWPAEVDRDYQADVEIVGDLADALWQLNEAVNDMYGDRLPLFDINDRAKLRGIMAGEFAAEKDDTAVPVKPQKILWDVREFMGPEDILLSDVGAHKMWIARHYQCVEPNTCLISNGFCTMGFAMPGSIGAKMANPDKRVLSISGDAGFMMNVQELETAVRRKLNIVAMVWCDGEYGLIKWKQQNGFQGRHSDLAFGNPDFVKLAESFGMWGREITATDQIIPTLEEAFRQEGPALIAIPVDYGENIKLSQRLGNVSVAL